MLKHSKCKHYKGLVSYTWYIRHKIIEQRKKLPYWLTRENINDISVSAKSSGTCGVPESSGAPASALYIREDSEGILLKAQRLGGC